MARTGALPGSPFPHDWLAFHAARTPDAPAISTLSARLSYRTLEERVRTMADALRACGIGPGDRVLVALPNVPATVVAGLAIPSLGAVSVEVSRRQRPDVLARVAKRAAVRAAIVWWRDADVWAPILADDPAITLWVVHPLPLPPAVRVGQKDVPLVADDGTLGWTVVRSGLGNVARLEPTQPALILFTSGSSGEPHGVVQTFRNIDSNTRSIVSYLELTAQDRAGLMLPLCYCYGRSVLQTHLLVGGSVHLDDRFAFPRTVLEAFANEQVTGFAGVPLTFEVIRRQVDMASVALPRLRYISQAGGGMAPETTAWARRSFAPAELFVMYGQTEATARLAYLPPSRADGREGSVGIPIPGVELRIVDPEGTELPPGQVGELVARGDNVTPGYLDEPEATAAILRAGWLWTGDLAYRDDDGFFYLKGRSKEILKIGGSRVSPGDIEQVIEDHPDVREAAVVAMEDDLLGEVPVALLVASHGRQPDVGALRRFCGERLPGPHVPARFVLVDALPRNEAGKLLRAEAAARLAAGSFEELAG